MRLKPSRRKQASRAGVTVRGSTSMDISTWSVMWKARRSEPTTRSSSASDRKVGEPPPKCSCVTRRVAPSAARTSSISVSSASRYSAARSWCLVMTLLHAQ